MKIVVLVQKELEDWWGVEDLLADNADLSIDQQNVLIVELLRDDLYSFLDGATWRIARMQS